MTIADLVSLFFVGWVIGMSFGALMTSLIERWEER